MSSILLFEPDPDLRSTRRLLLSSLGYPVLAVGGYQEICRLPLDSNCCLVAIDLSPNEREARRAAFHARRYWPEAQILLLGSPSDEFDDPLYDDAVPYAWNPAGVVHSARRLLDRARARQSARDAKYR
jgi:CheY-like chemotaxis protein